MEVIGSYIIGQKIALNAIKKSSCLFTGMSGDALRFVWGDPCRQEGQAEHQKWYYHGPVFSLAHAGWNCSGNFDTITEVQLVNGHVEWWKERIPGKREDIMRDRLRRRF